jgi:hypothetical protein
MPGQRHAGRNAGKDVRLVGEEDSGRIIRYLGERAWKVVDALVALPPLQEGDLVAKAEQSESTSFLVEANGVVLKERDAGRGQSLVGERRAALQPLSDGVVPPFMVAENGEGPECASKMASRGTTLDQVSGGLETRSVPA